MGLVELVLAAVVITIGVCYLVAPEASWSFESRTLPWRTWFARRGFSKTRYRIAGISSILLGVFVLVTGR